MSSEREFPLELLIPLQHCCPRCHRTNYHLSWKTCTGFCSNCGQWLGEIELYNTHRSRTRL